MFCEACHLREATVHLTTTVHAVSLGQEAGTQRAAHFCEQCADNYFSCTPGWNSARGLICLSDSYRSKLYDLLEAVHPEAFDNKDAEACRRGSEFMRDFLREHLKKDKIELNEDAFDMLCGEFYCSQLWCRRAYAARSVHPNRSIRIHVERMGAKESMLDLSQCARSGL